MEDIFISPVPIEFLSSEEIVLLKEDSLKDDNSNPILDNSDTYKTWGEWFKETEQNQPITQPTKEKRKKFSFIKKILRRLNFFLEEEE